MDGGPDPAKNLFRLAEERFAAEDFDAAALHLSKAIKIAPQRINYQELLIQSLYKGNRFKDTAEASRNLLKLDPGSAIAKHILDLAEKKLGL